MTPILELKKVNKGYQSKPIFQNFDLQIPQGSIFGLLGPNGAGKTTLIRLITQILIPDSGEILFDSKPIRSVSREVAYMPEERGLYKKMKVGEQLIYLGQIKGLSHSEAEKRSKSWLEKMSLGAYWSKKVDELSKGMQQKVQFIGTILADPKFIILDEPLSGLDPLNSEMINTEIQALQKNGATIMFSTHRLEQVEEICTDVILINQGEKLVEGKLEDIKQSFKKNQYKVTFQNGYDDLNLQNFQIVNKHKNQIIVQLNESQNSSELLNQLVQNKLEITSFQEILPSLNEIFIQKVTSSSSQN